MTTSEKETENITNDTKVSDDAKTADDAKTPDDAKTSEGVKASEDTNKEETKKESTEETTTPAPAKKEKRQQRPNPWPLRDIKEPHQNDVLYGRGGGTNHHPGNKKYRKMVEERKIDYVNAKRLDKPLIASEIIQKWRGQDPPGRFLKQSEATGLWYDVGDKKAREKTSQALREKAPLLRRQQEEEKLKAEGKFPEDDQERHDSDYHASTDEETNPIENRKTIDPAPYATRVGFSEVPVAENTHKSDPKLLKRSLLARDHSLGREYLKPGETVALENFSWEKPVEELNGEKDRSGHQQPQSQYDWNIDPTRLPPTTHYPKQNDLVPHSSSPRGHSSSPRGHSSSPRGHPTQSNFVAPIPTYAFPPPLKKKEHFAGHSGGKSAFSPTQLNDDSRPTEDDSARNLLEQTNNLYRSWSGEAAPDDIKKMPGPYGPEPTFRSVSGESEDYRPALYQQISHNIRLPGPVDDNLTRVSSIHSEDFKYPSNTGRNMISSQSRLSDHKDDYKHVKPRDYPVHHDARYQMSPRDIGPKPAPAGRETSVGSFLNGVFDDPVEKEPHVPSFAHGDDLRRTDHVGRSHSPQSRHPDNKDDYSHPKIRGKTLTAYHVMDTPPTTNTKKPVLGVRDMSDGTFLTNSVFADANDGEQQRLGFNPPPTDSTRMEFSRSPNHGHQSSMTNQYPQSTTTQHIQENASSSVPTPKTITWDSTTKPPMHEGMERIHQTPDHSTDTAPISPPVSPITDDSNFKNIPKPELVYRETSVGNFLEGVLDDDNEDGNINTDSQQKVENTTNIPDKTLSKPAPVQRDMSLGTFIQGVFDDPDENKQLEKNPQSVEVDQSPFPNHTCENTSSLAYTSHDENVATKVPQSPTRTYEPRIPQSTMRQSIPATSPESASPGTYDIPRPKPAKRATSNQNEDVNTKRDPKLIKRAFLNRDNSLSTDDLDSEDLPVNAAAECFNDKEEMQKLSCSMGKSKIIDTASKPSLLSKENRKSTIELISEDLKSWIENIS